MTINQSIIFFLAALFCSYQGLSQKLYFLDSFLSKSWRTSEGVTDLQEVSPNVSGKLSGFAIDPVGGHTYYAETKDAFGDGTPRIFRTALDGTGLQVIVPEADAGLPQQLVLDIQHQVVYWTSGKYPDVSIRRASMGGAGPSVVVDLTNSNSPKGIAVDPVGGKIYWTLEFENDIHFADLDGGNPGVFAGATNTDEYCTDLAIHPVEGKLYWITSGSFGESSKLRKANLDGSALSAIADLGFSTPLGVEVDTAHNKVYWSLWLDETVYRSDLNGNNTEEYFNAEDYISPEDVGDISDFAFDYAEPSGVFDAFVPSQSSGFRLFPNPAYGSDLTLEFLDGTLEGVKNLHVQVYDAQGKLLTLKSFVPNSRISFNQDLLPGFYQVLTRSDDGRALGSQRLIVQQ